MKRRGLQFGSYHTGNDWGLILNSKYYDPPKPKTKYLSVDGRDGDLDLSETLTGEIKYENRNGKYKFLMTNGTYKDRENLIAEILKAVHGRKMKIMIDDDLDHYMYGRCEISGIKNSNAYGEFTISTECDPWKYRVIETVRTVTVNNDEIELSCVNDGVKTVIPTLKVTGTIKINFDSFSVSLSEGTHKILDLKLRSGVKILTISGNGTLVLSYREAIL